MAGVRALSVLCVPSRDGGSSSTCPNRSSSGSPRQCRRPTTRPRSARAPRSPAAISTAVLGRKLGATQSWRWPPGSAPRRRRASTGSPRATSSSLRLKSEVVRISGAGTARPAGEGDDATVPATRRVVGPESLSGNTGEQLGARPRRGSGSPAVYRDRDGRTAGGADRIDTARGSEPVGGGRGTTRPQSGRRRRAASSLAPAAAHSRPVGTTRRRGSQPSRPPRPPTPNLSVVRVPRAWAIFPNRDRQITDAVTVCQGDRTLLRTSPDSANV
jgi:hypothetical protein